MTQVCLYFKGCRVRELPICSGDYERCIVYRKCRTLDKHKSKTGLERFVKRYPFYEIMFIGSKK